MRVLFMADRLSEKGGADRHLAQVVSDVVERGATVTLAVGRVEAGARPPERVRLVRIKGLSSAVETAAGLAGLDALLAKADVIHVQNVMNPEPVRRAVGTGRTVATVQDHRVFCPGAGRVLPDGSSCDRPMSFESCAVCLPDAAYREKALRLTASRRDALRGARLVVLSRYMAEELASVGLSGARVIPPWVEVGEPRADAGKGFVIAGRFVAHKAPLDAYRAWLLAGTDQPLFAAGSGPLATRMSDAERPGWLSNDAFREALSRARALLFPSRWQEPFGIVGLEALAAGTPVVAAVSGGMDDWAGAGCVRVRPGDVEAMAGAISSLAADPDLALRLGEEGRRSVSEAFSRRAIVSRLEKIYLEMAD